MHLSSFGGHGPRRDHRDRNDKTLGICKCWDDVGTTRLSIGPMDQGGETISHSAWGSFKQGMQSQTLKDQELSEPSGVGFGVSCKKSEKMTVN